MPGAIGIGHRFDGLNGFLSAIVKTNALEGNPSLSVQSVKSVSHQKKTSLRVLALEGLFKIQPFKIPPTQLNL